MKASELIKRLQELVEEYGDLEVEALDYYSDFLPIDDVYKNYNDKKPSFKVST